jgi:hypothetical protein
MRSPLGTRKQRGATSPVSISTQHGARSEGRQRRSTGGYNWSESRPSTTTTTMVMPNVGRCVGRSGWRHCWRSSRNASCRGWCNRTGFYEHRYCWRQRGWHDDEWCCHRKRRRSRYGQRGSHLAIHRRDRDSWMHGRSCYRRPDCRRPSLWRCCIPRVQMVVQQAQRGPSGRGGGRSGRKRRRSRSGGDDRR